MPTKTAAPQTSAIIATLETVYADLRKVWRDLPPVAITVHRDEKKKDALGYFWAEQWQAPQHRVHQIHISSTILNRSADELMHVLLHEAVHALALARNIADTSRRGKYHNKRFASLAADMGLKVIEVEIIGHTTIGLTPEAKKKFAAQIKKLQPVTRKLWQEHMPVRERKEASKETRMIKAVCACDEPRIIRIARKTYDQAPILCKACKKTFHLAGSTWPEAPETADT